VGRRRRNNSANLMAPVFVLVVFAAYSNAAFIDKAMRMLLVVALIGVCFLVILYFVTRQGNRLHSLSRVSVPENTAGVIDVKSCQKPFVDESKHNTKWTIELIDALEWKRFEELCSLYFEQKGYRVEMTRQGADGGVDINLFKNSYSNSKPFGIVQCKAWNSYKVGVKPVRELLGVMAAEKCPLGVFVTSGDYTREAREFSAGKHIKLMNGTRLLQQIRELPESSQRTLLDKVTRGDYTTPSCPACGIKMVTRTAMKGTNIGNKFWGCRNFPKCRSTLRVKKKHQTVVIPMSV